MNCPNCNAVDSMEIEFQQQRCITKRIIAMDRGGISIPRDVLDVLEYEIEHIACDRCGYRPENIWEVDFI